MIIMAKTAAKRYIKHPKTALAEVFKIAIDYAHEALKTLRGEKVLDAELRQKVQRVINKKLSGDENKPFRELIDLYYVQGKRAEEIAKQLKISIPQVYAWLADVKMIIADQMYVFKILAETYKTELIELLKTDPDMISAVEKTNDLKSTAERGRKPKA